MKKYYVHNGQKNSGPFNKEQLKGQKIKKDKSWAMPPDFSLVILLSALNKNQLDQHIPPKPHRTF